MVRIAVDGHKVNSPVPVTPSAATADDAQTKTTTAQQQTDWQRYREEPGIPTQLLKIQAGTDDSLAVISPFLAFFLCSSASRASRIRASVKASRGRFSISGTGTLIAAST